MRGEATDGCLKKERGEIGGGGAAAAGAGAGGGSCIGNILSKTIPVCFEELCGVAPLSGVMMAVMADHKSV